MIRRQAKVLRNSVPGNWSLTILLDIKAEGFVSAAGFACTMIRERRQQTQAGVQQRLSQQSRERSSWALPRANHQRAQHAVRQTVIRPKDAGLHRAGRNLGLAVVSNQTDPNLLGTKQKRKDMNGARPIRIVPGVLRYQNSIATDGPDSLTTPVVRYFHPVTPMKWYRQSREVRHIGDLRWSESKPRKISPPNSSAAKKLLQFAHNDFVSLGLGGKRTPVGPCHELLH